MAASGTGTLVFIDDVTQDRSSPMNSEVLGDILSAQIQLNAVKLIGRRFIIQMDSDLKHTAKATQEFIKAKKWNILECQVSHLSWKAMLSIYIPTLIYGYEVMSCG